jgi:hypothetical protein
MLMIETRHHVNTSWACPATPVSETTEVAEPEHHADVLGGTLASLSTPVTTRRRSLLAPEHALPGAPTPSAADSDDRSAA